ncbi:MAG: putative zinc-binding metallopeptidase [Nitrospirota bacterium]
MATPESAATPPAEPEWAAYTDEQLLELRICDLKLRIAGTELEGRIRTLYQELDRCRIAFKPVCYLGDEWFCPEGTTSIAIPFYLAHPRLKKLEERMMMEVEGGTEVWALRLLRHEMGHVMNHAYLLEQRPEWQKVFGSTSIDYSEYYRARPYSKRFVRHLEDWYAQSHPEEDFAETFAIWLTPALDWRRAYQGWKALDKLNYVDRLMQELAGQPPLVVSREKMSEASRLRSRLKLYYARRRRLYAQYLPDFFDPDLRRLFADAAAAPEAERAAAFLRRSRKQMLEAVAQWTGEPKFTINRLLRALSERCAALDLRLRDAAEPTGMAIAAYLASLATHYRLTGRLKHSKR